MNAAEAWDLTTKNRESTNDTHRRLLRKIRKAAKRGYYYVQVSYEDVHNGNQGDDAIQRLTDAGYSVRRDAFEESKYTIRWEIR